LRGVAGLPCGLPSGAAGLIAQKLSAVKKAQMS